MTVGLANKKTVTIQVGGKDQSVLLATTKTKKQNKPSTLLNKSAMKKEFRRMAKAVTNQVGILLLFYHWTGANILFSSFANLENEIAWLLCNLT